MFRILTCVKRVGFLTTHLLGRYVIGSVNGDRLQDTAPVLDTNRLCTGPIDWYVEHPGKIDPASWVRKPSSIEAGKWHE